VIRIYGTHIISFLLNLNLADRPACLVDMSNNESFSIIFHTLEWTSAYCKLVINIKERFYTSGKYSMTPLDDYQLYRDITLPNRVGRSLTEEASLQEYKDIYSEVWSNYSRYRYDPANLFLNFILNTLKSIEINTYTIDAFADFVQYFTNSHKPKFEVIWSTRT
jgi:hypothetical protein